MPISREAPSVSVARTESDVHAVDELRRVDVGLEAGVEREFGTSGKAAATSGRVVP